MALFSLARSCVYKRFVEANYTGVRRFEHLGRHLPPRPAPTFDPPITSHAWAHQIRKGESLPAPLVLTGGATVREDVVGPVLLPPPDPDAVVAPPLLSPGPMVLWVVPVSVVEFPAQFAPASAVTM